DRHRRLIPLAARRRASRVGRPHPVSLRRAMTNVITAEVVDETAAAAGTTAGGPRRRRSQDERRGRFGWVLLAPFAITFVLFLIVPLAYRSEEHTSELQS